MKRYFAILFIIASTPAWSQTDTTAYSLRFPHAVYERHSLQATLSLGFFDTYRTDYSVPAGFEKNNTSGYSNVSAKLDYGLGKHISLAASFGYDAFIYNFNQLYLGYNGTIKRYKTDNLKVFNVGLIACYHLGSLIRVKHLDPFVGVGLSLNNARYSAYPQGDSTLNKTDHMVTPYLKAGGRYYISDKFSLYADVGYEKQSILGLGFACRFFANNKPAK